MMNKKNRLSKLNRIRKRNGNKERRNSKQLNKKIKMTKIKKIKRTLIDLDIISWLVMTFTTTLMMIVRMKVSKSIKWVVIIQFTWVKFLSKDMLLSKNLVGVSFQRYGLQKI